jgi:thiopurine S-methyltransferase
MFMSNQRWQQMWKDNQIAFHQSDITPLLLQHFLTLKLNTPSRILVPLCGKSIDMAWLTTLGHHVVGIELSPIAIKAYFSERGVKPKKDRIGKFIRWRHGDCELWCGDVFDLTTINLMRDHLVYDNAALTCFPQAIRQSYVDHFHRCLPPRCQILLATTESLDHHSEVEETTIDSEIADLYQANYHVALLASKTRIQPDPSFPLHKPEAFCDKLYHISANMPA